MPAASFEYVTRIPLSPLVSQAPRSAYLSLRPPVRRFSRSSFHFFLASASFLVFRSSFCYFSTSSRFVSRSWFSYFCNRSSRVHCFLSFRPPRISFFVFSFFYTSFVSFLVPRFLLLLCLSCFSFFYFVCLVSLFFFLRLSLFVFSFFVLRSSSLVHRILYSFTSFRIACPFVLHLSLLIPHAFARTSFTHSFALSPHPSFLPLQSLLFTHPPIFVSRFPLLIPHLSLLITPLSPLLSLIPHLLLLIPLLPSLIFHIPHPPIFEALLATPHSSSFTPHPSLLLPPFIPHPSPLVPHFSHSSPLTPHPSPLVPHFSHSSSLTHLPLSPLISLIPHPPDPELSLAPPHSSSLTSHSSFLLPHSHPPVLIPPLSSFLSLISHSSSITSHPSFLSFLISHWC